MGRVTKGAGHVTKIRGYTWMVTLDRFRVHGSFTLAQIAVMVLHNRHNVVLVRWFNAEETVH